VSSTAEAATGKETAFHIPSLDGIRAISFFIVFIAHAGLKDIVPGYFGLSIFFFLSGFLITTLLRMEFEGTQDVSLRQFYLRRILRIFPPFYLILFTAMILTMTGFFVEGSVTLGAALAQVGHLTNYYVIYRGWWEGLAPGTPIYWSLAVEEHFYLIFPLLYLALRRRISSGGRMALVLAMLSVMVLAWRCVLIFVLHAARERTYLASDTRVDSILAGCILAVWHNPVLDPDSINDRRLAYLWLPLGTVSVLTSLVLLRGVDGFEQTLRYTLQSFGLLPLFVAAVRWHDRLPFRILGWAPLRRLGVYSYSMYLMHLSVLWVIGKRTHLSAIPKGALALVIVISLAAIIYRYVEKPCGRLRRILSRHIDSRARDDAADRAKPVAA
jgi:peptidoglycan/LPS O-acetylase OafA/YrhL